MSGESLFKEKFHWIRKGLESPLSVPVILFFISVASYGLLINRLGYYWDDFALAYIKNIYGSTGLVDYFSTNRPFWGSLFQITFSLFHQPWQWQVFALISRWLSAVIVWLLIKEIWRQHKYLAVWVSMLFLVYPGFKQQHVSIIYSNLFVILDCFLLSLYFNIKALHHSLTPSSTWRRWIWHGSALFLSLINLLALEYYFALDLIRAVLIYFALAGKGYERVKRIKISLANWWPYLALWIGVIVWRVFFFNFQTHNYQIVFFKALRETPITAFVTLFKDIGSSLWIAFVRAWMQVFKVPAIAEIGIRTIIITGLVILCIGGLTILYIVITGAQKSTREEAGSIILVGFIACLLGGVPWWLIDMPVSLIFPGDRFTLPFILGVSLLISGLLILLPLRTWAKALILGVLVALAAGSQFQTQNVFRRDWETQRRFFWQLAWRIPGLEPGTTIMVNDLPVTYFSDNSLTAPLNWFWGDANKSKEMPYLLLYPSQRLGKSLASLNPGTEIYVDYLAAEFKGNTSQVVAINYSPPACVRVLDPGLDMDNRMLIKEMQGAATLSSSSWIYSNGLLAEQILPAELYSSEPIHGWCYYFEKADLARQQSNWEEVVNLGDQAFKLDDYPNDPEERFPFIEGYAYMGNWSRALELSNQSQKITPLMEPLLCHLWQRIDNSTTGSEEKVITLSTLYTQLNCVP